uniref:DNA-directed DNA polymerase n=1 Tax=Strongyloides stercoralis TaxID=6248 RepID=A0A0K0EBY3_STRER
MEELDLFEHAKIIGKRTEEELIKFFNQNNLNNKQINGINQMIKTIFETSQLPVLAYALSFCDFKKVDCLNLKKIDLPFSPAPALRPKMSNEKKICYSINIKEDVTNYLNKIGNIPDDLIELKGIIFADDFSIGQNLGPYRNNISYCHVAYRLINVTKSSSSMHFRTISVVQTKKTVESIKSCTRNHNIRFLPMFNNLASDMFHDLLSNGIVNTLTTGCILQYLVLKKNCITEEQFTKRIIEEAEIIGEGKNLRTLLNKNYFNLKEFKNVYSKEKKSSLKMYGYQVHTLASCFLNVLNKDEKTSLQNENTIIKIEEFKCLMNCCLNLIKLSNDYQIPYKQASHQLRININTLFKCVFRIFSDNFQINTKLHNLLHYPEMVTYFKLSPGFFNLSRFEGANQKVKRILSNCFCKINISKTILSKIYFKNKIEEIFIENEDKPYIQHEYSIIDLPILPANFGRNITQELNEINKVINIDEDKNDDEF